MNDPIVDEVRKYRDEHARQFKYDIDRICEDYRIKHDDNMRKLMQIREEASADERGVYSK